MRREQRPSVVPAQSSSCSVFSGQLPSTRTRTSRTTEGPRPRRRAGLTAAVTVLMVAAVVLGALPCAPCADGTPKAAAVEAARAAALRGLAFTEKDAADWRQTK